MEPDPIRQWSERLRQLVAAAGLSHRQLADTPEIHFAHATISRYIKGERVGSNAWRLATQLVEATRTNGGPIDADLGELRRIYLRAVLAHKSLAATAVTAPPIEASGVPVPRQLPPTPALFTGRCAELTRLTAGLDDVSGPGETVLISVVTGIGGIGKTWLALRWAQDNIDRFPDGQLFIDLRGFDPSGEPTSPGTAVRGLLHALGVEMTQVPVELDAQLGRYRSLVAGKRMLIVLDNARDTEQVSRLLPGGPGCMVLITSRNRLDGLVAAHGAHRLVLDVLDEDEARALLVHRLGQNRWAAQPHAMAELLSYCAGLPLALGIVATRATAHPDFPLAALADELRNSSTRLAALDAGDPTANIATTFSSSYEVLDPEHAEAFRLLGQAPGPDIDLRAAVRLLGVSGAHARATLLALERASLLQQHVPDRWRMHDLIRLYAAERRLPDWDRRRRRAG